jgi:hypothetical protein
VGLPQRLQVPRGGIAVSKPSKSVVRACQLLRHRVRFKDSSALQWDDRDFRLCRRWKLTQAEKVELRRETMLYVESWIVPLLDAIESGDTHRLQLNTGKGDPMGRDFRDPEEF